MPKHQLHLKLVVCIALTSCFATHAHACKSSKTCVVGAEIDDAATIKARAKRGSGPDVGTASDERIKTDIKQVATLKNGIKVYAFKYLWDDTVRVGFLAQELQRRDDTRAAVLTLANGLLGVDFKSLGLRVATWEQWQKSGQASLRAEYNPQTRPYARPDEVVMLYNRRTGH